jgi:hypothetical protein
MLLSVLLITVNHKFVLPIFSICLKSENSGSCDCDLGSPTNTRKILCRISFNPNHNCVFIEFFSNSNSVHYYVHDFSRKSKQNNPPYLIYLNS